MVRRRDNVQLACTWVVAEPAPAAALNGGKLTVELGLQAIEAAKVSLNRLLQWPRRKFSTSRLLWGQILPEEGVVDVAWEEIREKESLSMSTLSPFLVV